MSVCRVIMFHTQISPTIFSHWFQTSNRKVLSLKIKDRNFNSNSFSGFLATKQDCFGFDCPFWHHFFPGMEMPVQKKPSSQPWSSVICVLSIMIRKFGMQSGCGLVKNLTLKTAEIFFEVQLETPNINTSQHQFAIIHKLELNIYKILLNKLHFSGLYLPTRRIKIKFVKWGLMSTRAQKKNSCPTDEVNCKFSCRRVDQDGIFGSKPADQGQFHA